MNPSFLRLLLPAVGVMLVAGCATPRAPHLVASAADEVPVPPPSDDKPVILPAAPPEIIAPHKPLTRSQQMAAQLHVMTGEMAAGRKQPELAAKEFLEALKLVDDAELAQRATLLAAAAKNEDLAMTAAQRWLQLAPNEAEPREVIARVALDHNQFDDAYKQLEVIVAGNAGGVDDGFHQAAVLLSQAGKEHGDAALTVMKRLVAKWPKEPAAHRSLGLLALRYNDLALADSAAHEALKLQPDSRDDSLLLAGVLVRQNKTADSDAIIEALVKKEKNPAELRLGYAKLLLENEQREAARAQLKKILADAPDNLDACFALGVLAVNDRNAAEAEKLLTPLLDTTRANDAAFQLGKLEENRKNYAKAMEYYERVANGAQALDAAVRRAALMAQTGHVKDGRELIGNLRDQFPQFADRFSLAEGDMLTNTGAYAEALEVYRQALADSPDNTELLYGRSLVYERQNDAAAAEKDLRAVLKLNPDDARAMNALGYLLTVHTKRLEEARKLIAHALELDPDDAAIIDSMGWVQYKLGNKSEARGLLQKAFDKFPDPEVAAHLGEVMWAMGDHDQARAVWTKALADDPDHPVLKETMHRFTQ